MRRASSSCRRSSTRGFTLIDVLVLIVLVGVIGGSMTVLFSQLAAQSAKTLRMEQSLIAAQSLLDEILVMPFTPCDPNPPRTNCTGVDALGPEPGETRYGLGAGLNRFDGVSDYQGFTMPGFGCPTGLCDMNGNALSTAGGPLTGCSASATVTPQALPLIAALDGSGRPQSLLVSVTVSCPGIDNIMVQGVRVRHEPGAY